LDGRKKTFLIYIYIILSSLKNNILHQGKYINIFNYHLINLIKIDFFQNNIQISIKYIFSKKIELKYSPCNEGKVLDPSIQ